MQSWVPNVLCANHSKPMYTRPQSRERSYPRGPRCIHLYLTSSTSQTTRSSFYLSLITPPNPSRLSGVLSPWNLGLDGDLLLWLLCSCPRRHSVRITLRTRRLARTFSASADWWWFSFSFQRVLKEIHLWALWLYHTWGLILHAARSIARLSKWVAQVLLCLWQLISTPFQKVITDMKARLKDPDIARLFENTFPNTLGALLLTCIPT